MNPRFIVIHFNACSHLRLRHAEFLCFPSFYDLAEITFWIEGHTRPRTSGLVNASTALQGHLTRRENRDPYYVNEPANSDLFSGYCDASQNGWRSIYRTDLLLNQTNCRLTAHTAA